MSAEGSGSCFDATNYGIGEARSCLFYLDKFQKITGDEI
jgi:hypothetical protein